MSGALNLCPGPAVSQLLTALSDLVNLGERGLASLQVLVARMNVGLLGERRVVMTRPLADDRDRHARVLTGSEHCSNPANRLAGTSAGVLLRDLSKDSSGRTPTSAGPLDSRCGRGGGLGRPGRGHAAEEGPSGS